MPVDNFPTDLSNPVFPDVAVDSTTPYGNNHDITDTESGQLNVSVLSGPISLGGWPGNGIPLFSDFNKLFRLITQWIRWFWVTGWHDASTTIMSGSFTATSHFTESINLPSGWTAATSIVLSIRITLGAYGSGTTFVSVPFNYPNGGAGGRSFVSADMLAANEIYFRSDNVSPGTQFDLNAGTYKIILKKIS